MNDKDSILDKIKKLLRMKRGGTPSEIETALALAAELAHKHGIDLASVNPDEQSESQRISHVSDILNSRMPAEARFAAAILVNFFNVEVVISKKMVTNGGFFMERRYILNLIGTSWDCQVARYVFVFLQRAMRSAWNHRPNRRLKNRYAFLNGMFLGLADKLDRQKQVQSGSPGIVLISKAVQLRKDYLKQHWPNAEDSPLDKDDSDAMGSKLAGIRAGQDTDIRSGLNAAPQTAPLQLPPATP